MNFFIHSLLYAVLFGLVLSEPIPQWGFADGVKGLAGNTERPISEGALDISEDVNADSSGSKLIDVVYDVLYTEDYDMSSTIPEYPIDREESSLCNELYEYDAAKNPVGEIYSPFYLEEGKYPNSLWCEYRITAAEGNVLKLTFVDFDMEATYGCYGNKLTIYANKQEFVINNICGREIPEPIITDPGVNIVHFVFRTDSTGTGRGFHILYEAAPSFGVDAISCDKNLLKKYEDRCDKLYDKVNDEALAIKDDSERTKTICCALEDHEKCSLRAFEKANCFNEKKEMRENLKAARLFLRLVANVNCAGYRGQCLVLSEPMPQSGLSDFVKGLVGDAGRSISDGVLKIAEDVNADNIGSKLKDVIYDVLDVDDDIHTTTEFMGVDATGCDRGIRKRYEDRCDEQYDKVNDEAQAIEDDSARTEAICCALEDFEKCSIRAFDKANCLKDQAAIRENLKAARLFLSVVANISCAAYRGQCAYYSSAISSYSVGFGTAVLAVMLSLGILS